MRSMARNKARDVRATVTVDFEYVRGPLDRRSDRWAIGIAAVPALVVGVWPTLAGHWILGLCIAGAFPVMAWLAVWLQHRCCIRAGGDDLVVVNGFWTHRLKRSDIRAFRLTPPSPSKMQHLEIVMPDYVTIDCDVTLPPKFPGPTRTRPDLFECKAALDSWLHRSNSEPQRSSPTS